ncbi:MAG: triose-phosphate isomerase [Thermodesulfobacteriota bacterium]|nr:triose-phosphate isomerase [Thermodesulfobacteriota bacterium]
MRRPMIAGNWKMFKDKDGVKAFAKELCSKVKDVSDRDILVCPPAVYLESLSRAFSGTKIKTGAQNIFWEDEGAYTGEISGSMAKDAGADYTLIGHSERRQYFHETDETVNKRLIAALKHGLIPVVCVGERLEERQDKRTFDVIGTQIRQGLKGITDAQAVSIIFAYEPVWAIGTGKTATPDIAQEVHAYIRGTIQGVLGKDRAEGMRILYGGSVKPGNVDDLMCQPDIDGALVGGASLEASSFGKIIRFRG